MYDYTMYVNTYTTLACIHTHNYTSTQVGVYNTGYYMYMYMQVETLREEYNCNIDKMAVEIHKAEKVGAVHQMATLFLRCG